MKRMGFAVNSSVRNTLNERNKIKIPKTADVVIVGGGVIGASIAYSLTRRNIKPVIIERAPGGGGSSVACEGLLLLQSKKPGLHTDMTLASLKMFMELSAELGHDIEFENRGSLMVIETPEELKAVKPYIEKKNASGSEIVVLDRNQVLDMEPVLSPEITGASFSPLDSLVNPLLLTLGYLKAAVAGGAILCNGVAVIPCSFLAMGQGFEPNTELARLAGCSVKHDQDLGGWVVKVSPELETSVLGIFAAGELTAIAGAGKSRVEGRLAGLGILKHLDCIASEAYRQQVKPLLAGRGRELGFGRAFNKNCSISDEAIGAIPDSTIICRCEDVSASQIRQAAEFGMTTLNAAKWSTRTGMGICQGRTCGPIVHDLLRVCAGADSTELEPPSVRTPVKAVRLSELATPLQEFKWP